MNNCVRAQVVWKQLIFRNHLNLYGVITFFIKLLHNFMIILKNDNAQQQFVYFIVTICCNTLKSFKVSFCKEKQSEILDSCFYQRHTLNTKKSDICHCEFKNTFFTEHLWWQLQLAKQIKRKNKIDTLQIFLSKLKQAEVIIKFNESVFW